MKNFYLLLVLCPIHICAQWPGNFSVGETYLSPASTPAIDSTKLFDVVFNELMADPSPVVGLPEQEYLELYNRSNRNISLKGWKLTIGTNTFTFPKYNLPVNSYLLITSKAGVSKFSIYGPTIGLFTSSTTLINTELFLKLENRDGRLIHWLEYNNIWYNDDYKLQGGWSLEQIDPMNPCGDKSNWTASKAKAGGTPGTKNSVSAANPDYTIPELFRTNIPADSLIDLYFNEPIDSIMATDFHTYTITPDIGHPKQVVILTKNFMSVRLFLPTKLKQKKPYILLITKGISDCTGNSIQEEHSIPFSLPEEADSADIVINEVLFNAYPNGTDYLEIYNRSGKTLNAHQLFIGLKTENSTIDHLCRVSETGCLIPPFSYWLLTYDKERVKRFYTIEQEKNIIELPCMPLLNDKASTVVLLNADFKLLDKLSYSAKMHLSTLKNTEGISLERLNPDTPTAFPGNWHSASESVGYGTPGRINSQYLPDSVSSAQITIEEEIFSPDNDGYKDILQVSYKFDKSCYRVQVYIFDCTGRLVRKLLNNELLGTQGFFTWDGMNEGGKRCDVGIYVLFIRIVSDDGTVQEYKKSCILALRH